VVINFQYGWPINARVGDVSGIPPFPKKNVPVDPETYLRTCSSI
jgi:hypothetical protein